MLIFIVLFDEPLARKQTQVNMHNPYSGLYISYNSRQHVFTRCKRLIKYQSEPNETMKRCVPCMVNISSRRRTHSSCSTQGWLTQYIYSVQRVLVFFDKYCPQENILSQCKTRYGYAIGEYPLIAPRGLISLISKEWGLTWTLPTSENPEIL